MIVEDMARQRGVIRLWGVAVMVAVVAMMLSAEKVQAKAPASTIEIIERVNDYWQQTHSPLTNAFWDNAAYHTGNMEAWGLLGHARWHDYSARWANHNLWQGAREKDTAKWKYKKYGEGQDYVLFGDWQICFQTYLDLYRAEHGDLNEDIDGRGLSLASYKTRRAIEVMDYEVRTPQNDYWWWADALYMVMPVMTKLYKATGEVKYLDKLYSCFLFADSLMFDKDVHLYYRDARYIYPKHKTEQGKRDFWARGNGWVLAGLAKVLADMPEDYRHRDIFVKRFCALAEAVAACQQNDGYWSRSMLDEEQAEGPETSGTAFFCYGLLWGVNHGLLAQEDFQEAIDNAWKFLTVRALQKSGAVGYVQPIGDRAVRGQQLSSKSEANFGVGAFLLAACEHLRFEDAQRAKKAKASEVVVEVENATDDYRHEVIETDAETIFKRLGLQGGRQVVVTDAVGLEVPYQLTHDGKILIELSLQAGTSTKFRIRRGTPHSYQTFCYGRQFAERKDDYAWENDRTAYRVYGPALEATGEKSFGIDVWAKSTPGLVLEKRYWSEDVVWMPTVERLRKEDRRRGDSLYVTVSYHHEHGQGLDPYKVGATLGCGAPALLDDEGKIVFPWCYETCEVLDNGPLRTAVHLTYPKTFVGGDSVREHRVVTLDKQSNFSRMRVWYEGLTKRRSLVGGLVLHGGSLQPRISGTTVAYADPTDNVKATAAPIFVGLVFKGSDVAMQELQGHAVGMVTGYGGEPYTYYFGSAWAKNDVRSIDEWSLRMEWFGRSLHNPLKIRIR